MSHIFNHALQRVVAAYNTVPPTLDPRAWVCIATFTAIIIPLGVLTGILQLKVEKRPAKWLEVLFVVFCSRGLLEEVVFRVVALPHQAVDGPISPGGFALRAAASTLLFVLAHLLIPGERAKKTFRNPGFLVMCGVFGAMCSAVYYLTGSLFVIWLVHGLPVAIWLLLLGGAEKVQ
eukprot:GHRR01005290.1.p1 GENE.GHRR01005290.1~~GHRR01005290.1.p1  ORF type:complete len:176 (+),score=28.40 GHRR01005290.1:139-666(+)